MPADTPPVRVAATTGAKDRLGAKRRRARSLRTTIASGTLAVFVALWLLLYVQLASGEDPALTANAASDTTSARAAAQAAAAASALHRRRHELAVARRARARAAATAATTSTAAAAAPAVDTPSTSTTSPSSVADTTSVSATPMTTRQS